MHVLFLTHWFPTPETPIYGIFILEHARAAAQHHQVSLLHIGGLDKQLDGDISIKVENHSPNLTIYHLSYKHLFLSKTGWIQQLRGALRAYDMAAERYGRPDVIHANIAHTAGLAYFLRLVKRIPAVLSEHSSAWPRDLLSRWQIQIYRWFLNRIDAVLPVSSDLQEHMQSMGVHNRFTLLPNVVDDALFHPNAGNPNGDSHVLRAITVARLDENKAVHLLIEALSQLKIEGFPISLQIIGDGPERGRLERMCEELGIRDQVSFKGLKNKPFIAEQLRLADFFAMCSLWENQPVALLEALLTGLPVVAPAVGGIPEILTAKNAPACGKLFKAGDAVDLKNQIKSLIVELGRYNNLEISAYARAEYGSLAVGRRLDEIYNRVAAQ